MTEVTATIGTTWNTLEAVSSGKGTLWNTKEIVSVERYFFWDVYWVNLYESWGVLEL